MDEAQALPVETTEPVQPEETQAAPAPEYLTKADFEALKDSLFKEAAEQGRRAAQSRFDKEQAKIREAIQARLAAVDDPKLSQYIPDEDRATIKAEYQAQLRQYEPPVPEPVPAPEQGNVALQEMVAQAAETLGITLDEVPPSNFASFKDWHAAAAKKSEAKRHNPRQPTPMDMGQRTPASNAKALLDRHRTALEAGDMETARKISQQIDQITGS